MAENIPVEDSDYVPWYLDEANQPVCPSFWEEFECDRPACPFSHKTARFMTSVVFTEDLTSDLLAMHKFLLAYISSHPNKELLNTQPDPNFENEKDFDKIDQLLDDMADFERGINLIEPGTFCPLLKETGNCLLKGLCEYAHSLVDDTGNDEGDWQDVWYPDFMSCECCKGYLYKCSAEACRSQGKCLVCPSKGV